MAIRERQHLSYIHPIKAIGMEAGQIDYFDDFQYNPDKEFDMMISGFWWHTKSGSLDVPVNSDSSLWGDRHYSQLTAPVRANWRVVAHGAHNSRLTSDEAKINKNLILSLDTTEINFSYAHELSASIDDVIKKGSGGVLEKTQQLLEGIRAANAIASAATSGAGVGGATDPGVFMPMYKNVKAWTGTTPLTVDQIKLNFYFGQAGLFDAYEEVVKPITHLAMLNMPMAGGSSIYNLKGPVPSVAFLIQKFVVAFASSARESASNLFGEQENRTGLSAGAALDAFSRTGATTDDGKSFAGGLDAMSTAATRILSAAYTAYNTAVEQAMSGNSKLFTFRMGRMVWGPCLVKDVKWSFDFAEVDNFGMPTKGSITLSGIEKMSMALPHDIDIYPRAKTPISVNVGEQSNDTKES